MQTLEFPIHFTFNISTLSNDFIATDANNKEVAYVKQKLFKLKEQIKVYNDQSKQTLLYTINADRWIDFSAAYKFTDANGEDIGRIARKGWSSLWKARYHLIDQHDEMQYEIKEENGWIKVIDGIVGEIPFLGAFTGYFFNPSYLVSNMAGEEVARITKEPSFWGRKFEVTKLQAFDADDGERIMLGLMMMILLERRRG